MTGFNLQSKIALTQTIEEEIDAAKTMTPYEAAEEFHARRFAFRSLRNPDLSGSLEQWHQLAQLAKDKENIPFYLGERAFAEGDYENAYRYIEPFSDSCLTGRERARCFYLICLITGRSAKAENVRSNFLSKAPHEAAFIDSSRVSGLDKLSSLSPGDLIQEDLDLIELAHNQGVVGESRVLGRYNALIGANLGLYASYFISQASEKISYSNPQFPLAMMRGLSLRFNRESVLTELRDLNEKFSGDISVSEAYALTLAEVGLLDQSFGEAVAIYSKIPSNRRIVRVLFDIALHKDNEVLATWLFNYYGETVLKPNDLHLSKLCLLALESNNREIAARCIEHISPSFIFAPLRQVAAEILSGESPEIGDFPTVGKIIPVAGEIWVRLEKLHSNDRKNYSDLRTFNEGERKELAEIERLTENPSLKNSEQIALVRRKVLTYAADQNVSRTLREKLLSVSEALFPKIERKPTTPATGPKHGPTREGDDPTHKAEELYNAGKYQDALGTAGNVLRLDPLNIRARVVAINCLAKFDNSIQLKRVLLEGLIAEPKNGYLLGRLFTLSIMTQDFKQALAILEDVVKTDPKHASANQVLGLRQFKYGDRNAAFETFGKCPPPNRSAVVWAGMLGLAAEAKDGNSIDKVISEYNDARDKSHSKNWFNTGFAMLSDIAINSLNKTQYPDSYKQRIAGWVGHGSSRLECAIFFCEAIGIASRQEMESLVNKTLMNDLKPATHRVPILSTRSRNEEEEDYIAALARKMAGMPRSSVNPFWRNAADLSAIDTKARIVASKSRTN